MNELPSSALKSPESLRDFCLKELETAGNNPAHLWRLASMALVDTEGMPTAMKIVLRDYHKGNLSIFTDYRSAKIQSLGQKPKVSLCFYNPQLGLQLSALCSVSIHNQDLICQAYWQKLNESSRSCYASKPNPGSVLEQPFSFITYDSCEIPYDNFAVLKCAILSFDILVLNSSGNIRLKGDFSTPSSISWTAP